MRQRGFTLIELLIVVAIIGMVAAIAIPNLLSAIQRARQKRTMSGMRGISEGIEIYQQDHGAYPDYADVPVSALAGDLEPYVRPFDPKDGWNRTYWYGASGDGSDMLSIQLTVGWLQSPFDPRVCVSARYDRLKSRFVSST